MAIYFAGTLYFGLQLVGVIRILLRLLAALVLFSEGTKYFQAGNQQQAWILYQEAKKIDPSLHEHAREALSRMAQDCSPKTAGPIYYWLGAHSDYVRDLKQAATWYGKAIHAFSLMGY